MRNILSVLLLAVCAFSAFADHLNPVNPNFNYPEVTVVDPTRLNNPYLANYTTGFLTVNNNTKSKLFYVNYPAGGSKNKNADFNNSAPLILWLQGGPGCSDATGNYEEIGPFTIRNQNGQLKPVLNNVTWNDNYNLLFIDSPVGVGFSVSGNERPDNAVDTVKYLQIFLIRFFQLYPSLAKNDFYIFGESYAGHYIPALAALIVSNNTQNGIKIKGIGVGNGWTDPVTQIGSFSEFTYSSSNSDNKARTQVLLYEHIVREYIKIGNWSGATGMFDELTDYITGINNHVSPYNFEVYTFPPSYYPDWLNSTGVKQIMGVDLTMDFKDCVDQTYMDFYPDIMKSYMGNYTYLLTQTTVPNFRAIVYSGQNDIIVNTVGTLNWLKKLDWYGNTGFIAAKKKNLKNASGGVIGNYKTYKTLTYATIYNAGHMVPGDQPTSAKIMLDTFIKNQFNSQMEEISA